MSTHFVRFFSEGLARDGEFYVHLAPKSLPDFLKGTNPEYDRPARTLILLHGFNGTCTDWLYHTPVADWSMKYNLNIVMPAGGVSFYLDKKATGQKYCQFIGSDLIRYLRETFGIAVNREDTFIGGNSMGGFGAIHTALAYPENFSGVIALSSALVIDQLSLMTPEDNNPMANYEYYLDTFGDLQKAATSDHNPEVLFTRNRSAGKTNPKIFTACGSEDFLIQPNRRFRDFLQQQKADYLYVEAHGMHNWDFWIPHAEMGIQYLLKK